MSIDNESLVEALNYCACEDADCDSCKFSHSCDGINGLMSAAANRIEELIDEMQWN